MNNKDYQKKIDEHRQSIEIDESEIRLSRTKRRRNRKKETPLLTTLTFILIGIPLVILIYVWGFWEPEVAQTAGEKEDESLIEVERNNTVALGKEKNEEEDKDKIDKSEKQEESSNEKEPNENKLSDEEKNNAVKDEEKTKESSKDEKQEPEQKQQDEQKNEGNKEEPEPTKEQEEQKEEQPSTPEQPEVKIHTVQPNENLFRIALKYYSDPMSGVEKIKAANNLPSETITVGQSLVIPN